MNREFPEGRACRALIKMTVLPLLILVIPILSINADEFRGVIIKNDNSGNRIVLVGNEWNYLFNDPDTPEVTIYDKTNPEKGTYSITSFSNDFIIQENQCLLKDFDRIGGEGIYLLAIGKYFNSPVPETVILMYPDSDDFCGNPDIFWLNRKILAERVRIDASGNFYLLGVLVPENPETVGQNFPGEHPLLHKFTPEGTLVYSSFVRHVDLPPDRFSGNYTKPILPPSSLAVSTKGEVWILWNSVDPGNAVKNNKSSESGLFHANPAGEIIEIDPDPPETGYTLTGLLKNSSSSEVLFAWEDFSPNRDVNTVLTTPDGTVVMKRSFSGRVLSVSDDLVVTKTNIVRIGIRKNALIMYSHD